MTGRKEFGVGGRKPAEKPYHYTACGLDDVYLLNGFNVEETEYGNGVAVEDVDALHNAIALHLVTHRKRLNAKEFRFLRKQMNMTQQDMAKCLQVDAQTVARYEKSETAISGPADQLVRIFYALSTMPKKDRLRIIEELKELVEADEPSHLHPLHFRATEQGWIEAA